MVLNAVQSLKESATITERMKLKFRTFITGLSARHARRPSNQRRLGRAG